MSLDFLSLWCLLAFFFLLFFTLSTIASNFFYAFHIHVVLQQILFSVSKWHVLQVNFQWSAILWHACACSSEMKYFKDACQCLCISAERWEVSSGKLSGFLSVYMAVLSLVSQSRPGTRLLTALWQGLTCSLRLRAFFYFLK